MRSTGTRSLITQACEALSVSRAEVLRVLALDAPTGADFDLLVDIAAVTGADLADLIPGRDRRDRPDPRTGVVNPCAHHEHEVVDDSAEAVVDVESAPDLDPDVVELVTKIDTRLQAATAGEPVHVPAWGRMAIAEEIDRLAARTLPGAHRLVAVLEHHQIRTGALL